MSLKLFCPMKGSGMKGEIKDIREKGCLFVFRINFTRGIELKNYPI